MNVCYKQIRMELCCVLHAIGEKLKSFQFENVMVELRALFQVFYECECVNLFN